MLLSLGLGSQIGIMEVYDDDDDGDDINDVDDKRYLTIFEAMKYLIQTNGERLPRAQGCCR